jgi:ABC-type multidrug transport system ATPase subunit
LAHNAVVVEGLTKVYPRARAVDEVSFTIGEREIFGLLGPNGAGKTTTIRMLLTLVKVTAGTVSVFSVNALAYPDKVRQMAESKVIVKRLASIENFGSMSVLCSDKTGTLTEGIIRLHSTLDIGGEESQKVLLYAYLNAFYETGYANPIDEAIRTRHQFDVTSY